MSTFELIVVGIDGSDVAAAALDWAADEADRRGSRLLIVHVGDVPPEGEPHTHDLEVHDFAQILRSEAIATVAESHPHVLCETLVVQGDPARVLVDLSATADLVAVGTHRMGRLRGFVLGSVSQRVAAHARCPVVTISGPTTADRDAAAIFLGASNTPGGLAAMRFACTEARVRHVTVRAVRAISVDDWALPGVAYPMADGLAALEITARLQLDSVVATARREFPDVAVEAVLTTDSPFTALIKATDDAGLIVVGARRGEDTSLFHLGPVASWLLHQAQCPTVVVPFPVGATTSVPDGTGRSTLLAPTGSDT
jgi:nucleotide-binding universal stress UspA family protein